MALGRRFEGSLTEVFGLAVTGPVNQPWPERWGLTRSRWQRDGMARWSHASAEELI